MHEHFFFIMFAHIILFANIIWFKPEESINSMYTRSYIGELYAEKICRMLCVFVFWRITISQYQTTCWQASLCTAKGAHTLSISCTRSVISRKASVSQVTNKLWSLSWDHGSLARDAQCMCTLRGLLIWDRGRSGEALETNVFPPLVIYDLTKIKGKNWRLLETEEEVECHSKVWKGGYQWNWMWKKK